MHAAAARVSVRPAALWFLPLPQEYVFRVDPLSSLGLSSDSIVCYRMGDVIRSHASEVPELLPCGYLVGDSNVIKVNLKGTAARKRAAG